MKNKSLYQMAKFFVVGILGVSIDFGLYTVFTALGIDIIISKAVSFVIGCTVAFILNKIWTFKSLNAIAHEIYKYVILYIITAAVNTTVNSKVIYFIETYNIEKFYFGTVNIGDISRVSYIVGYICATSVSTILNFLGLRFFVFRNSGHQ